jgi:hypothetical protein
MRSANLSRNIGSRSGRAGRSKNLYFLFVGPYEDLTLTPNPTWYGAMRIPYAAIDSRPAAAGNTLRINLLRCQGPASSRHYIAWRAPMRDGFHVPERFGTLKLME